MTDTRFFKAPRPRNACNYVEQQRARQLLVISLYTVAQYRGQLELMLDTIRELQELYLGDLGNEYILKLR